MASRAAMQIQERRAANRAKADPEYRAGVAAVLFGQRETGNEKRSWALWQRAALLCRRRLPRPIAAIQQKPWRELVSSLIIM
jgi:hypothetical protein